jgi:hypothetical protein
MIKTSPLPSREHLHELFTYDSQLGALRWAVPRQKIQVGNVAGWINARGRRKIVVDRKEYYAYRLIWCYHYGDMGPKEVDHADRDHTNDRIENLRVVDRSGNNMNKVAKKGYRSTKYGTYEVWVGGTYYGTHRCPLLARVAYEDAHKSQYGALSPY